ncbi:GntR family transcriptional regulator [Planktotalea sp.]|uniref:GntR family transcriptional regulator n=1 Tax=Planktotalea sp. TaxID=2029877 RepID=UPI003D6A1188
MNSASRGLEAASTPTHELVYQTLRDMVLFGDFEPGQAVTIQGLTQSLSAGVTPVREAIRRLIAEGALQMQGNRRVCVPVLKASDVQELLYARIALETELTRRAMTRVQPADLERLSQIDSRLDSAIAAGNIRAYLQLNHLFHTELFKISEAPVLHEITDKLWLRFGPLLRDFIENNGLPDMPDCHKDLLTAFEQQDRESAERAIIGDIEQGIGRIKTFEGTA